MFASCENYVSIGHIISRRYGLHGNLGMTRSVVSASVRERGRRVLTSEGHFCYKFTRKRVLDEFLMTVNMGIVQAYNTGAC